MDLNISSVKTWLKAALLLMVLCSYLIAACQQLEFHEILRLYQLRNDDEFIANTSMELATRGFSPIKSGQKNRQSFQNQPGENIHFIKKKKKVISIECTATNDSVFAGWVRTLILDGYKLERQFVKKDDPYSLYKKDGLEITVGKSYNSAPQIEYSLLLKEAVKVSH